MTAATVGVSLSDVYGSFTHMVQTLDITTICRAHELEEYCDNARTGKHISLTQCFVISADVDSGDSVEKTKFSSVSQTFGLCLGLELGISMAR